MRIPSLGAIRVRKRSAHERANQTAECRSAPVAIVEQAQGTEETAKKPRQASSMADGDASVYASAGLAVHHSLFDEYTLPPSTSLFVDADFGLDGEIDWQMDIDMTEGNEDAFWPFDM